MMDKATISVAHCPLDITMLFQKGCDTLAYFDVIGNIPYTFSSSPNELCRCGSVKESISVKNQPAIVWTDFSGKEKRRLTIPEEPGSVSKAVSLHGGGIAAIRGYLVWELIDKTDLLIVRDYTVILKKRIQHINGRVNIFPSTQGFYLYGSMERGSSDEHAPLNPYALQKKDQNGGAEWELRFDTFDPLLDWSIPDIDGDIFGGSIYRHISKDSRCPGIIKVSHCGSLIWVYNGNDHDEAYKSASLLPDGGLLVIGVNRSPIFINESTRIKSFLCRLSCDGKLVWKREYTWAHIQSCSFSSIVSVSNGYLIAMFAHLSVEPLHFLLINSSGDVLAHTKTAIYSSNDAVSHGLFKKNGEYQFLIEERVWVEKKAQSRYHWYPSGFCSI